MPIIREYTSRVQPTGRLAAPRITGQDLTPAGELVQLSKTLGALTASYEVTRRETRVAAKAAEAARSLQEFVFGLQNGTTDEAGNFTPPPDPVEHPRLFQERVKDANSQAAQSLGDEQLVERFQQHFAPLVTTQSLDVQRVALDRQKDQVIADLNTQEDALAQVIVGTGSTAGEHAADTTARASLTATYSRMVEAGVLTAVQAGDRLEKFDQKVSTAFVIADIRNDPDKALLGLVGGEAYAGLPPEQRERWASIAQRAVERREKAVAAQRPLCQ